MKSVIVIQLGLFSAPPTPLSSKKTVNPSDTMDNQLEILLVLVLVIGEMSKHQDAEAA
jgi:hypothetical protein